MNDINHLHAEFFKGNIKMYVQFISFLHTDMTHVAEILSDVRQELAYSTVNIHVYHGCCCPGAVRSQGISNHDWSMLNQNNSVPAR